MKMGTFIVLGLFAFSAHAKQILKLGHALPPTHPVHASLEKFAQLVKERTHGEIEVSLAHSGLLGNEREMIQKVQRGFLAFTKTSTSVMEGFVPEYGTLSLPYLFKDDAHRWKVLEGEIGQNFLKLGENKGFEGLAFLDAGTRSFYTKKGPVTKVSDMKGLKVRIQNSETMKKVAMSMGAFPTPLSFDELYTSIGAGVVDAAENNLPSFSDARHYEVAKFYNQNEHSATPDMLVASETVWKRLTPAQQVAVKSAAVDAALEQRAQWKAATDKALADLKTKGVQFVAVDKESFRVAVQKVYAEFKASTSASDRRIASLAESIQAVK